MEATPGIQVMADEVERWCKDVYWNRRDHRSLVIAGPFGCGKTTVLRKASAFVRMVYMDRLYHEWKRPISLIELEFAKLCADLEAQRNRDFADDVRAADVVFIDDIGAEEDRFKSGAATRVLGDLLGDLETKFTLITTNVDRRQNGWRLRWDPRVEDRLLRRGSVTCNLWALGARSFVMEGQ